MKTRIRENMNTPEINSQSFFNILIYILFAIGMGAIFVYLWNIIGYMSFIFLPFILVEIFLEFGKIRKYFQKKIITFQEVKGNSLVKEYPRNINFMNHHNYFRNYELEKKYKKYIYIEKSRKILKNGYLLFAILLMFFLIPEAFSFMILIVFSVFMFLILPVLILIWKDKIMDKLLGRKSSALLKHDIIYFRRINPAAFQKSGDIIFFY